MTMCSHPLSFSGALDLLNLHTRHDLELGRLERAEIYLKMDLVSMGGSHLLFRPRVFILIRACVEVCATLLPSNTVTTLVTTLESAWALFTQVPYKLNTS